MKSYYDLVTKVLTDGSFRREPNKECDILSYFGYLFEHNMSNGFPLLTSKKMAYKQVFSELEWFIKGKTDLKWLLDNNNDIWLGDAFKRYGESYENYMGYDKGTLSIEEFKEAILLTNEKEKVEHHDLFFYNGLDLGPIYGSQWRGTDNPYAPDQLMNLIDDLKNKPFSRRHLITAWNPIENENMILPACHFAFQCYVREVNKEKVLDLMWYQRSVDLALGLPFNIASYGLLLHLIAKECGYKVGILKATLGDVHIYKNHIDNLIEQKKRQLLKLPSIDISDTNLFNFNYKKVKLNNYSSHSKIKYNLVN